MRPRRVRLKLRLDIERLRLGSRFGRRRGPWPLDVAQRAALLAVALAAAASPSAGQGLVLREPAAEHYDLVALRVEFQPDTSRFTTGDGTFEGDLFSPGLSARVDPLPHDASYFEAHLEFLRHYVERVSDGKTSVSTHLIPEVVRVPASMSAYAPSGPEAGSEEELGRLARLVSDAWSAADAQSAFSIDALDPDRTAFLLFHAGVGRDVELTGTTLNRTPGDLPSIFFGPSMLDRLLAEEVRFKGLRIDHAIVLPRTEVREGLNFITDEAFLIELSINGMLAASFFNFLGVPDLFDTREGTSAIGPYGLMDPLGIFAFNGLFPPEPSAWTKYFLGWAEPRELRDAESSRVALRAASSPESTDLARARISDAEYFLVENRHRDPEDDGIVLTIWREGSVYEQRFQNGDEGFNAFNIEAFEGGVVVAVDNYDWALPGGLDEEGGELNGGILIWHVDERVIAAGLAENTVNADPSRRGIDLEEADSAQDLGFPSQNPFSPQADLGSPFDFWYEGNPVRVLNQFGQEIALYENRFGPDTHPATRTNDGGESFLVLDDFSGAAAEMDFRYGRVAVAGVRKVDGHPAIVEALEGRTVDRASFWMRDGQAGQPPASLLVSDWHTADGAWEYGVFSTEGGGPLSITGASVSVRFEEGFAFAGRQSDGLLYAWSVSLSGEIEAPQMLSAAPDARLVGHPVSTGVDYRRVHFLLDEQGTAVVAILESGAVSRSTHPEIGSPVGLAGDGTEGVVLFGRSGATMAHADDRWRFDLPADDSVGAVLFGRDAAGLFGVVPLPQRGEFLFLGENEGVLTVDAREVAIGGNVESAELSIHPFPVLADLDEDGHLEVLTGSGPVLLAFTRSGALAPGHPVRLSAALSAQPVLATGSEGTHLLFVPLADGSIHGLERRDRRWQNLEGFPLAAGDGVAGISLVPSAQDGVGSDTFRLMALSGSGSLSVWEIEDIVSTRWAMLHGDARRTSFALAEEDDGPAQASGTLLVPGEVYNWPNPIREGQTFIRCMTKQDSEVAVTIVDGAGSLVDRFVMGPVRAGVPREVIWETNQASGLYFARVTATTPSGLSDTKLVKMAIIR